MRYLILSDIHANIDAFDAVLDHASGRWDRALVLGDLVGYGAEPNAVVGALRALQPGARIRGNPDRAACGIAGGSQFNRVARLAALWTGEQLAPGNHAYLRALQMGPIEIDALTEICHGAPFDEDHYIFDVGDAHMALQSAGHPLCLYGHTHLPAIFKIVDHDAASFEGMPADPDRDIVIPLQRGTQYLINVGAVGQPRDGDPRAAYGVLDDDAREVRLFRVPYPGEGAQKKTTAGGWRASLATRVALGR